MSVNLELVETRNLIDELLKRYHGAIFAGRKNRDGCETDYESRYTAGDLRVCQGLACAVINKCNQEIDELSEHVSSDDPHSP